MEFSYVLRKLREEKGLSQKDIAEHLGITRQAVAFYELGKREPDYQILRKLADYFGVSIDYLLGRVICKDVNALTIGKNIELIMEGKSIEEFSKDISRKTGTVMFEEVLEIYLKGEKVPNTGTLKILAKYAGVKDSFFYVHNTYDTYQQEKEVCRNEAEMSDLLNRHVKGGEQERRSAEAQIKLWALQDENIEFVQLAKLIKEADLKATDLLPFIESVKKQM